ncbi:MAG: S-layer homology domain-containing protein [Anaerovoracaceae bacterium]|jgi:hypothetical protein
MKKFAALLLSAVMIMTGMFALPVFADDSTAPAVTDWDVYTSHGGTVVGSGYSTCDEQYVTMTVTFDKNIVIADPVKAYDEFTVMLNKDVSEQPITITSTKEYTNGDAYPVYGTLSAGSDGKSVVFKLYYGFAPYASRLTIEPVSTITQITGEDGTPVSWENVDLYIPNGVTFSTVSRTVGTSSTCASVTKQVSAPSDSTRMMIHVLFLKNGEPVGETDTYGSNLTTHFHDYLTLGADGYVSLLKGWFTNKFGSDYTLTTNGSQFTVTANNAEEGEVLDLMVYAYPQDRDTGADKTALESSISKAENIDSSQYTVASYTNLKSKLAEAKAADNCIYYLQSQIDEVKSELDTAISNLEIKTAENDDTNFPFTDVSTDRWSRGAIVYVYNKNLFSGTSATTFDPSASMSRAMLVTVLYRMDGASYSGANSFSDVSSGSYYYDAVGWAAANGIVSGTSATTFSPDNAITREQMACIFYRYAQYKGFSTSETAELSKYTDASSVSSYATTAMSWAVGSGLISGTSSTELSPQLGATREQTAAIIQRFSEKYMN